MMDQELMPRLACPMDDSRSSDISLPGLTCAMTDSSGSDTGMPEDNSAPLQEIIAASAIWK